MVVYPALYAFVLVYEAGLTTKNFLCGFSHSYNFLLTGTRLSIKETEAASVIRPVYPTGYVRGSGIDV